MNELNKIICDTINNAYSNKEKQLNRDVTYICTVTEVNEKSNYYELTYEDKKYYIRPSNIKLKLYDVVHLIIPQGNFKNMYILEDVSTGIVAGNYSVLNKNANTDIVLFDSNGFIPTNNINTVEVTNNIIKTDEFNNATILISQAEIKDAEIEQAQIKELRTDYAHITNGVIDNANIDCANVNNLKVNYAHINNGVIDNATIDDANINNLDVNYAHISNGVIDNANIDYAKVNNLDANYASINLANVNNAWIQNGVIKDAAIVDSKIGGLSANKITTGTIDASKINVTNLNADNLTVGTINGKRIGQGSIDLDKLSQEVPTKEEYEKAVAEIEKEMNGTITAYTVDTVPLLTNYPTNQWGEKDEVKPKLIHVGDICYVKNAGNLVDGFCYRFFNLGTIIEPSFEWIQITDTYVLDALKAYIDEHGDVEGFSEIKKYDVTLSSWRTDSEYELSNLMSKYTEVENSLGDKISTTVFNEVKQTAESNSSTINELTTTVGNHGKTLESHTTSIKQNADDIALKADSKTVSDLESRMSDAELKITDEAIVSTVCSSETYKKDLSSKADNESFDSLEVRVSSAEEKITDEAIVSTVTQSTTYTDDLSGKTNSSEIISTINQTAESITINADKLNLKGYLTITNANKSYDAIGSADAAAKGITDNIYSANTTTIDGEKITTNSINADKINVSTFTDIGDVEGSHVHIDADSVDIMNGETNYMSVTENGFKLKSGTTLQANNNFVQGLDFQGCEDSYVRHVEKLDTYSTSTGMLMSNYLSPIVESNGLTRTPMSYCQIGASANTGVINNNDIIYKSSVINFNVSVEDSNQYSRMSLLADDITINKIDIWGDILYQSDTGSNGTLTFNKDVSKYRYIDIGYEYSIEDNWYKHTTRVYRKANKTMQGFVLHLICPGATANLSIQNKAFNITCTDSSTTFSVAAQKISNQYNNYIGSVYINYVVGFGN
ncbi:MAG: hypothetical protein SO206_07115 [Bacilli bacterium]|nr:hypothetical protein [Bacilli bacterium]